MTLILSLDPTSTEKKGQVRSSGFVARTGSWIAKVKVRQPGDLNAQILTLLGPTPAESDVWEKIHARFQCDLFAGIFMQTSNCGLTLSPEASSAMSLRRLPLHLDIYDDNMSDL